MMRSDVPVTSAWSESLLICPRASEQVAGRVPGKAAGRPDGGASGASENAAGRRPGAAQPRYGGMSTGSELSGRGRSVSDFIGGNFIGGDFIGGNFIGGNFIRAA
jgi:hypothetical protein